MCVSVCIGANVWLIHGDVRVCMLRTTNIFDFGFRADIDYMSSAQRQRVNLRPWGAAGHRDIKRAPSIGDSSANTPRSVLP